MNGNKNIGRDLKIIIVGDCSTGKTSILNRFILNKYESNYKATITSQFSSKIVKVDKISYRVQFWDLAGQDKNPVIANIFCKNANGIIFCCDITKKETRENIKKWREVINDSLDLTNISTIIVENKCDIKGNNEIAYNEDIEELKKFSTDNEFGNCFRTSALNGYGIENAINFLISDIIVRNPQENQVYRDTMCLRPSNENIKRKKDCCQ